MKYDITIVCSENDFYLGDLICQKMEALGKRCLFNLRDAPRPDVVHKFLDKSPIYIAVVNKDFFTTGNGNYVRLTKFECNNPGSTVYLFVNEEGVDIPEKWGNPTLIDANAGWEENLMEAVANGLPVDGLCDAAMTSARIEELKNASAQIGDIRSEQLQSETTPAIASPTETPKSGVTVRESRKDSLEALWNILGRHKKDRIQDMLLPQSPKSVMVIRAMKYYLGDGVVRDLERSYSLLKRAVKEDPDDMEALYYLAVFSETGEAGIKDIAEAQRIYTQTMERGFIPSMLRLGCIAFNSGTSEGEATAMEIFRKARKAGDFRASYWLGLSAEKSGEEEDAFEYYSEAAEEGFAPAQNAIGCMYFEGLWVRQDENKAIEWIKLAANQGLPVAMANLGDLLIRTQGMNEEAQKFIRAAADCGDERGVALSQKLDMYAQQEREEAARRRKEAERQEQMENLMGSVGDLFGTLFRGTR